MGWIVELISEEDNCFEGYMESIIPEAIYV